MGDPHCGGRLGSVLAKKNTVGTYTLDKTTAVKRRTTKKKQCRRAGKNKQFGDYMTIPVTPPTKIFITACLSCLAIITMPTLVIGQISRFTAMWACVHFLHGGCTFIASWITH